MSYSRVIADRKENIFGRTSRTRIDPPTLNVGHRRRTRVINYLFNETDTNENHNRNTLLDKD